VAEDTEDGFRSLSTDELVERIFPGWKQNDGTVTKMVAPMVRYSKLPFRLLCRKWGADLCFTPMLIAESFNRSERARLDFQTHEFDQPLLVQFAANDPIELAAAAFKVRKYALGVDINCGCPQRWAVKECIGAWLSGKPEIVKSMVQETRKLTNVPVSIKIRLRSNIRESVDLIQQAERAGVSWVTIHGRTLEERTKAPMHWDDIKMLKEISKVPIVANGDINTQHDIMDAVKKTGVDGVMCARGILANPAMFSGVDEVPLEAIMDYVELALRLGGHFTIHQHHIAYMLGSLSRADRREFNMTRSMAGVLNFFKRRKMWTRDLQTENILQSWC